MILGDSKPKLVVEYRVKLEVRQIYRVWCLGGMSPAFAEDNNRVRTRLSGNPALYVVAG
jgi:hypothetical protein